jgi:hypothetical protein
MYEELGSVREPVELSPSKALSSAEELLRRQGCRIIYRTGVMVVGMCEDPNSLVSREPVHLAVFARPHPAGGLRITLQGDDREGVRERASGAGGPMVCRRSKRGRRVSVSGQLERWVRRRRRCGQDNRRLKSRQRLRRSGDHLLAPGRGKDAMIPDLLAQNHDRNLRAAR